MSMNISRIDRYFVFLSIGVTLLAFGCGKPDQSPSPNSATKKLKVVVTTGMIADLVRQIGGELITVEQLMISGVDPHLYRPNVDDVKAIRSADIVFYNGLHLEGRMGDILGKNPKGKTFIAVAETLPAESVLGDPDHDTVDPHVWMDVNLWTTASESIEQSLTDRLPTNKAELAERAQQLRSRLKKLDEQGLELMQSIPPEKRVLVTSHDAFRYFGKRYGLRVEGIVGISTVSEADGGRIPALVNLLHENKIPTAFIESSVPAKQVQSLVEGAASKGTNVLIGGPLYSDAMGPDGSGAETYEGMMLHNFRLIAKSLGGEQGAEPARKE